MGMFDDVVFASCCPCCETPCARFQSKAGPCSLARLTPDDVGNFYALCDTCRAWLEFTREPSGLWRLEVTDPADKLQEVYKARPLEQWSYR